MWVLAPYEGSWALRKMNTIRIKHQDGDCIFEIKSVEMELSDGYLDIEITSRKNEDCPLGFFPPPSLYLENATIFCKSIDEIYPSPLKVLEKVVEIRY